MTRVRRGLVAASLSLLACSSSSNTPPRDGAAPDGRLVDASPADVSDASVAEVPEVGPSAPDGSDASCDDPLAQTATLRGEGFAPWEGLSVLGCFSAPSADTACNDADVTAGVFTVMAGVCDGQRWDVYVFDGARGLNCSTTRAPGDRVFTVTPADCTCASPHREVSAGCAEEADGGVGSDAGPSEIAAAPDGPSAG